MVTLTALYGFKATGGSISYLIQYDPLFGIIKLWKNHLVFTRLFKDTCYVWSKSSTNQQPLDIWAYDLANKPSFKNLTKLLIVAVFAIYIASTLNNLTDIGGLSPWKKTSKFTWVSTNVIILNKINTLFTETLAAVLLHNNSSHTSNVLNVWIKLPIFNNEINPVWHEWWFLDKFNLNP